MNKFELKAMELEILGNLYKELERMEKDTCEVYTDTGRQEQRKVWNSSIGDYELVWEDEAQTIPDMRNVWEYVPTPYDELTDEKKAKMDAIKKVKTYLEKLI